MNTKQLVFGPTFEEMLHPSKIDPEVRERALAAAKDDPLNALNLYNITWRNPEGGIYYIVLPKELTGVDANIVALSGIAIAIGTIVDMGIIVCENILKHLDEAGPNDNRLEVIFKASSEVGGAVVTAVSTTVVGFCPSSR